MKPLIHKTCALCEVNKPRKQSFGTNPGQPDGFSTTCKQCQREIKDGTRKRAPSASDKQREFSRGCNGLLLDAVWRGYANWSEATTAHDRWSRNLRQLHTGHALGNTLGTTAPQTTGDDNGTT